MKFIVTSMYNLYKEPGILSYQKHDYKFLIPGGYTAFMFLGAEVGPEKVQFISTLLDDAVSRGVAENIEGGGHSDNQSVIEAAIQFVAINGNQSEIYFLQKKGEPVTETQLKLLESKSINLFTFEDLQSLLYKDKIDQEETGQVGLRNKANTKNNLLISLLAVIAITSAIIFGSIYLSDLISVLPGWLWIPLIILCSFILFWFRGNCRFYYGVFEFVAGATASANAFLKNDIDNVTLVIAVLGGMYIMVRGIENIYKDKFDTKLGVVARKYKFRL